MPRKAKKYHYLYKTTNTVNNKFYVGMHSTDNLEDGYLGSGKYLRNSIKKYGRDKFKIEFLEFFKTRDDLVEREKNLVNEDLIKTPLCMNLRPGGEGGFLSIENQRKRSSAGGTATQKKFLEDDKFRAKISKIRSDQMKNHPNLITCNWTNRKHKQTTKDKIGRTNSEKQRGVKNSQFGTCWIFKSFENKKIKKSDLNLYLQQGWIKGRITNTCNKEG